MPGASQSIEILAPREVVYGVIVDYDRYPEFVPRLKGIRIKGREPGVSTVEMHVEMMKDITYTLRIVEDAPRGIRWGLVEGPMKTNNGGWSLEDLGSGRTRATYNIDMDIGFFVPKAVVDKMVSQSLPANLAAFKQRSEALARR
ncbi:SRPBCC family protein [Myxococcota bacterium]|nr:SRPBCC family protein [Myxococcota bacterium]